MKLKEARLTAKLQQTDVVPKLKAVEPRADVGMLSRYENGVCLPTPPQFNILCTLYHKQPHELYDLTEVDLGVKRPIKPTASESDDTYKLTARIPLVFLGNVDKLNMMLKVCGYKGITGWVLSCLKRLQAEYAARQKNTASDTGISKAAS